jgi:hypothetical protein
VADEIRPRAEASWTSAADHGARGYDPRDLAHMFETIQRQGGNGGPEWLTATRTRVTGWSINQEARSFALRRVRTIQGSSRRSRD